MSVIAIKEKIEKQIMELSFEDRKIFLRDLLINLGKSKKLKLNRINKKTKLKNSTNLLLAEIQSDMEFGKQKMPLSEQLTKEEIEYFASF